MKKIFLAMAYSIRWFVVSNCEKLLFVVGAIWLVVSIGIGYNLWPINYVGYMPTEESYKEYKTIILQIVEGNIREVEMPVNANISFKSKSIVISNSHSMYSVTGDFTETEISFTTDDGASDRESERILYGGFVLGTILIGIIGGIILYYVFKFLFFIVSSFIKIIREIRREYEKRKKELEYEESTKSKTINK